MTWNFWRNKVRSNCKNVRTRQIPQFCKVISLEDLALLCGSVSVKGKVDASVLFVLVREGNPGTEGNLGTNDAITWNRNLVGLCFFSESMQREYAEYILFPLSLDR